MAVGDGHIAELTFDMLLFFCVALLVNESIGLFQEDFCVLTRQKSLLAKLFDELHVIAGFFNCALGTEL